MGERLIRVVFPNGKILEMSVTGEEATIAIDGKKVEMPHSILMGARRKIRT